MMARVKKVMLSDVPTLKKEAKIEQAAKLLVKSKCGCIVIVENDAPVGMITELDFVRNIVSNAAGMKEPVSRIMSFPVTTMTPEMKLDEALKIIDTKRFRKYPVVENGRLTGLVTKKDVVQAISDNLRMHRNIQNTVLIVFVLFELFIFLLYRSIYQYIHFGA